jgi:hypothetical protein
MKIKSYILLILLLVSVIGVTAYSYFYAPTKYKDYCGDITQEPIITPVLKGAVAGVYPWTKGEQGKNYDDEPVQHLDILFILKEIAKMEDEREKAEAEEEAKKDAAKAAENEEKSKASEKEVAEKEDAEEDDGIVPPKEKELVKVDASYFDDAVLVGDSRMLGLSMYCSELDERATFFARKSISIFDLRSKAWIENDDGSKETLYQAISRVNFTKVYIMVGINELGVGTSEGFRDAYKEVIDNILEIRPDAKIYINSIMHVSKQKNDKDQLFNNKNIEERNAALQELADGQQIFYLNINEALDDENGNLNEDWTSDGIHLKGSCYEPWYKYLMDHAAVD